MTATQDATPERDPAAATFTVDDLLPTGDRRGRLGRTPQLTMDALRLVRRASPRNLIAMFTLQLLSGAAVAGQLLVARRIMQELLRVSQGGSADALYAPIAAFAAVSVLMATLNALAVHQQRLLVELVGRYAFDRIIDVGASADYRLLETAEFYNQLQRAQASGDFRIAGMVTGVSQLASALLTTAGIAVVLALLSPLLLAFVLIAAIPALLAAVVNSRESHAFEYSMTAESRERAYVMGLMTSRDAAKEVRLLGLGPHLRGRYRALTEERLRQLREFLRRRLRVSLLGGFASALGLAIALGSLVVLLADGHIGVAAALTAALAMQQLAGRLTTITGSVAQLIESGLFLDDYQAFVQITPAGLRPVDEAAEGGGRMTGPFDRVAVEGVSFTYPGAARATLQDVSLDVRPGEIVALVGANGSGKTTLVKLICQLYSPDSGRVVWNGTDAATLAPALVAADITVLFQDYLAYHLSARENIAFGRIEKTARLEEVTAAARRAGAHDFIAALPDGYETRMGLEFEGGRELSIGQWQRLALARAFFREGSFLILDEPTASLDPRAESELFTQMRDLSAGRSVLLISHRFSSARSADRIYVLDGGRIIETGTHAQLVARGGHYAELFGLQAAAYLGEEGSDERDPSL